MPEVENFLQKIINDGGSPSVQYMLFNEDSVIKQVQFGLADISGKKSITGKSAYNAFSVTKTFTALAVLQLAAQNKIDIEQPVKKYLPGFIYSPEITIRQLLSHAAGIPNPIPLSWIHLRHEHELFDRNLFFKRVFDKNSKAKTKPGQKFSYSNLGYVILGQLIEKITGSRYEQYITENIIQKLGLTDDLLGFEIHDTGLQAKGYHKRFSFTNLVLGFFIDKSKYMGPAEGKWKPFYNFYVNGTSYGGLIGTPAAFVRYIQELLKESSALIAGSYKKMLFTESRSTNNRSTGMCLSWFTGRLNGHEYFTHAGGGGGYYCEIRIYPEKKMGSVVFFNRTGMSDERFLDKVDRYYFNNTE